VGSRLHAQNPKRVGSINLDRCALDSGFFGIAGTVLTVALAAMWLLVGAKTLAGAWRGNLFVSPCIATPN